MPLPVPPPAAEPTAFADAEAALAGADATDRRRYGHALLDLAECHIRLVIKGRGKASARIWTCDFTEGYIKINGSYRT